MKPERVVGVEPPGLPGAVGRAEVLAMGFPRRRPEPAVVVESRRHGSHRGGAARHAPDAPRVDVPQLADASVAHDLARPAEERAGALLRAELEDPPGLPDRGPQRLVLGDAQAHRLLQVDVLARPHCGQRDQDVPVIRGGDDHGVDVRAGQNLSEVGVGCARPVLVVLVDQLARRLQLVRLHVAHGHDPRVLLGQEPLHDSLALRAGSHERDGNLVAGGDAPGDTPHGRGQDRGECQGRPGTSPRPPAGTGAG